MLKSKRHDFNLQNGLDETGACLTLTLVQVLLHTKLVQLTINGPVSLLCECVRTVR
jgi:hypothetical protein